MAKTMTKAEYASYIQRSILPRKETLDALLPEYFVLWEPRDMVGGDIYWCRPWGEGTLVMLGDCTGHGVPGAFMTLISNGALDKAYLEVPPGDPARLLQHMHQSIQSTLGQDHDNKSASDDGIEAGACFLNHKEGSMIFAGAKFDLFISDKKEITVIKGTKSGLGYRGIAWHVIFTNHYVDFSSKQTYYMTSDGMTEQVGFETRRCFGKNRLKALILSLGDMPLSEQKERFRQALLDYQGDQKRRDDVSIIGFKGWDTVSYGHKESRQNGATLSR